MPLKQCNAGCRGQSTACMLDSAASEVSSQIDEHSPLKHERLYLIVLSFV